MINHKSKISFVMPAYNSADTIKESVSSIILGNFEKGDEIIIVNDGSTDKTAQVLQKLKAKYPFLIIIHNNKNKGCPATRNIGIKMAKNPLIFNLDADDVLVSGSVLELKKYLIKNKADLAAFAESHFFKNNIKKITLKRYYKSGTYTLADFLAGLITPGGNFLYTKKSWGKIGGYWEYGAGLHEFWGFTLKQLASGSKFMVMPNSFYYHRYGHESLFIRENRKENESSLIATKMLSHYFNLIEEEDISYVKNNKNTWFSNLNKHPIRVKGQEYGQNGKVIYPFNTKTTIKKLIIYITKRLKLYYTLKKCLLRINFKKEFRGFKRLAEKNNEENKKISDKQKYGCGCFWFRK